MNFNEIVNELIDGTGFEINSESKVLTNNQKVRTPIEAINCVLGGGIPFSTIVHTFGRPKGGKSTWLYQMMGIFQKQYPEGVSVILDTESSADPNRLVALGVDPSKVIRLPATSIESGFLALIKMLKNKKDNAKIKDVPIYVIWDTLSRGLAQDNSTQSRMNAQDRARIIKNYLGQLTTVISNQPFILCLINQAIIRVDSYGNSKVEAPGGIALQHDVHLSTRIDFRSEDLDQTKSFVLDKWSIISIDKSKISPEIRGVPFKIDVRLGGVIEERESFLWYTIETLGYISMSKGWYTFKPLYDIYSSKTDEFSVKVKNYVFQYVKSYRYDTVVELIKTDDIIYNILRYTFIEYISSTFTLQSKVIEPYKLEVFNLINESISNLNTTEEVISESSDNSNEENIQ